MRPLLERRAFLAASAAALAACNRGGGTRYAGHVFVANQEGRAVAVVDLSAFAVVRHIPLDQAPHLVITRPGTDAVFVAADDRLVEISGERLEVLRSAKLAAPATELAFSADGATLYALTPQARSMAAVDVRTLVPRAIGLNGEPGRFTLSRDGKWAAASLPRQGALAMVDLAANQLTERVAVGGDPWTIRFRSDGRMLVAGDRAGRAAVFVDLNEPQPRLAVRVPLGLQPAQLREKPDGGQMFFTGPGLDSVVTVYPYRTEVGSTSLAGRAPGYMAISPAPEYLFVANPTAATVTILNVATQGILGAVGVGREPGHISVTPDGQYALVLNRLSGDMSVLYVPTLEGGRTKAAGLFTQIPVGSGPVSAAVRLG